MDHAEIEATAKKKQRRGKNLSFVGENKSRIGEQTEQQLNQTKYRHARQNAKSLRQGRRHLIPDNLIKVDDNPKRILSQRAKNMISAATSKKEKTQHENQFTHP